MNNFRTIWLCARINLYKWLVNPRIHVFACHRCFLAVDVCMGIGVCGSSEGPRISVDLPVLIFHFNYVSDIWLLNDATLL